MALAATLLLGSLLAAADTVIWLHLEQDLDRRLVGFSRVAGGAGWRFVAQAGARGGWPFSATLILARPSLRLAGAGLTAPGWSGETAVVSVPLLHPDRPLLLLRGTQSLSLAGGTPLLLRFWAAAIELRLPATSGPGAHRLVFQSEALHLGLPGAGPDDIAVAAGATGAVTWAPPGETDNAASVSLAFRDVALPIGLGRAEDRVLQRIRLQADIKGGLPKVPTSHAFRAWQQAGGRIALREASLDWGGSGAALAGDAVLLPDGFPEGRFTLFLTDPDRLLKQMREHGLIAPGALVASRAVLGLVAAADTGPQLRLPLRLHGGVLALGEIPLLSTGRIVSPDMPPP